MSERQTAHLEPLGGRRHVLLNSSEEASVRVMYNPAKGWVRQNVAICNRRCVLSDLRSETFSTIQTDFVGLEPLGTFGTQLC